MDYSRLNNAIREVISYNLTLDNLSNYIEPTSYVQDLSIEYIASEYAVFEKWFMKYIAEHPITKDIAVLNFNIVNNENCFLIDILTFESYNSNNFDWAKKPINNYRYEETANILSKLTPSGNESADISFISVSIIIAFVNTFYSRLKKHLTKDRSFLGMYPPLRISINFEQEPIHIIKIV